MLIQVVLEALTGSFNSDIQRSAKQAERDLKRMEAESRKALGQFGKILATAAVTAATGLAVMVKSAINSADELGKLSQKVGIAVEDLSKLAYAAKLSDVDLGQLQQSLVKLGDSAVQAQSGTGDTAEAFKALGVEVKDVEGNLKSSNELFLELADAFASIEDGPAKIAAGIDIFGRSFAELLPLLNEGSKGIKASGDELERFGGVVSGEVADAADEFNDNLDKIAKASSSLAQQVAADLLPDLIKLSNEFLNLVGNGKGVSEIAGDIATAFRGLIRLAIATANAFQIVGESIGGIALAAALFKSGKFIAAFNVVKELKADVLRDVADINRAFEDAGEVIRKTDGLIAGFLDQPKGRLNYDPSSAKKVADEAKKAAQETRRLQEAIAQGDADIFRAQLDRERQALEASLDLRLISYQGFLNEKLRLTEAEIDAEIAAAEALLQGAAADEAAILQARIQTLEIERQIARESKTQEEAKYARELADAYEDAARAAQSYVDEISRAGQRELLLLDLTPSERRFAQGQFQIEDRFRSDVEQLDTLGLEQEEYDKRLSALQGFYAQATDEHRKYFEAIEAKQKDFTTGFNNAINEYIDATQNAGAVLGDTLVEALDEATHAASRAAAEFILFGESPREAIYQLARTIATELLSALIRVAVQALLTKTLLAAIGGPAAGGVAALPGRAGGGYAGDLPENKIAGVYHGKEFIVNAEATRQNRGLLEAINSGTFSGDAASVPSSSGQGFKPETNVRVINVPDKSYIKDYLMSDDGDEVFVNWVGRNGTRIKQAVAS